MSEEVKNDKWAIIDEIIEKELEMFLEVKAKQDGGQLCQERPETFKLMRWMSHSVLSADTLASYRDDLIEARSADRNLVVEKYARMEGAIPQIKENELIYQIGEIESEWMKSLKERYPKTIKGDRNSFRHYLLCELETYSDRTLELLMKDIKVAQVRKLNLPELRYKNLFRRLGYKSLDEVEAKAK